MLEGRRKSVRAQYREKELPAGKTGAMGEEIIRGTTSIKEARKRDGESERKKQR